MNHSVKMFILRRLRWLAVAFQSKEFSSKKIMLTFIPVSLVFSFCQFQSHFVNKKELLAEDIDTYIPEGFVLLPIDLNNADSLDGLLEAKGVVDLYTIGARGLEKTAEAIKIIRSPRKPNQFAVLVPESKARYLISKLQAFHAVIHNPNNHHARIEPIKIKKKRSITIELDDTPTLNEYIDKNNDN